MLLHTLFTIVFTWNSELGWVWLTSIKYHENQSTVSDNVFFYQSWSSIMKFCIKIDILISNFQFIRAYGFSLFSMKCPGTTISVCISVCVRESFRHAIIEDCCLIILHDFTSCLLLYLSFLISSLWLCISKT